MKLLKVVYVEKLLGIKINDKLTLNSHVEDVCKKDSMKIYPLARVTPYMTGSKKCILMNAFFRSQFSYCPFVLMCHSRTLNNKTNKLHERCFGNVYNDKLSSFQNLLDRTDLFQRTLVICKQLLWKCIKCLKVLHRRYLMIISAVVLMQIMIYVISLSLVDK